MPTRPLLLPALQARAALLVRMALLVRDGGGAPDPVSDKAVLVARAKELGVAGVGSHWGTGKLQEAIAEAQKKSEG